VTRGRKSEPRRLTVADKQRLLKPRDDVDEIAAGLLAAWARVKRRVRVPGVTAAELTALVKRWKRAKKRERAIEERQARLADARLLAGDALFRRILEVWRMARAVGVADPDVSQAFAEVARQITTRYGRAATGRPERDEARVDHVARASRAG
jgi:hypothetical protein